MLDPGPRFRFRSASAWSSAIKRGDTVFGCPEDEKGRDIGHYLPNDGTPSFYFCRLRYMIWPDPPCCNALKQWGHCGRRPDGTIGLGRDVKPTAVPVLIVLLNDDDERVRNEAACAIGVIGDRADTS